MVSFILFALLIVIASISLQSYVLSQPKGLLFKVFMLIFNFFLGTGGLIVASFMNATNSDPFDGGLPEFVQGSFTAILAVPSYFVLLLIAFVVQLIVNAKKKRKVKEDSSSNL